MGPHTGGVNGNGGGEWSGRSGWLSPRTAK